MSHQHSPTSSGVRRYGQASHLAHGKSSSPPSLTTTIMLRLLLFFIVFGLFAFITFHSQLELGATEDIGSKIVVRQSLKKHTPTRSLRFDPEFAIESLRKDIPHAIVNWEEGWLNRPWIESGRRDFGNYLQKFSTSSKYGEGVKGDGTGGGTNNGIRSFNSRKSSIGIQNIAPRSPPKNHKLECPHADLVTFWRPMTTRDYEYKNPFKIEGEEEKYCTFEPDVGGWNNIRMQMETVLVFAAATGRTLVLPPDQPMYLLNAGKGHQKEHSFADFFPFDLINQVVPVISMEEFMRREGVTGRLRRSNDSEVQLPPGNRTEFMGTNRDDRNLMWEYLRNVTTCPQWKCMKDFLVIPPGPGVNVSTWPDAAEYRRRRDIFAASRTPYYYDDYWQRQKVVHFISKPGLGFRLLEHFYTFIHFEDPRQDRYYKRFVRNFVHYIDTIFCKAAIIVNALNNEGNGYYSAFHIRRGEFQYKEVKIPAEEWMANIGQFIPKDELLYMASDERNKSFFLPFRKGHRLRFLDDYMDLAGLSDVNPNYLGMIDQVVCSKGRVFFGTWFSTFTGYITRMRGYHGYHDHSVWYGDKKHRDRFQHDELPMFPFYMREWNVSWAQIDEV